MPQAAHLAPPPWHLWGHDLSVAASVTAATSPSTAQSQQLVRVDYGRPETWFFALSAIPTDVQGAAATLDVFFDINIGVGRSVIIIPGFEHYVFALPGDAGKQIWSTQVTPPKRSAAETVPNVCSTFSAQSINVVARTVLTSAGATSCNVQVSALFTPSTHVRPEWYEGEFPGGEMLGH
jgi:hypothetical protein